jgi:hypothetical protein
MRELPGGYEPTTTRLIDVDAVHRYLRGVIGAIGHTGGGRSDGRGHVVGLYREGGSAWHVLFRITTLAYLADVYVLPSIAAAVSK